MSTMRGRADRSAGVDTPRGLIRAIAVVGFAGIATGVLVGGLGSRVFMRLSAVAAPAAAQGATTEAGNTVGVISFDGTMGIVVFVGIGAGIVGAFAYAVYRPWLAWAGRWRGPAFGVVLLALASATSDSLNPDNPDFVILGRPALNVAMILGLFLGFGLVMEALVATFDRRLPPAGAGRRGAETAYAVTTGLGVALAALAIPTFLFSSNACSCDPAVAASASLVVAALGTLVLWATQVSARPSSWSSTAKALGYAGLAGTLVFGLWRAGGDVVEILAG